MKKIRILVVDDEPISVQSIVYMIEKNFNNAKVIGTCSTGKSAIEKALTDHPDIILMDIQMQGINGLEAIKQIKENNANVSIIILSAFDYFDYAKEAISLGVEDYLLKPVKEATFVDTLSDVFDKHSKKAELRRQKLEQQEKLEMVTPVVETNFIFTMCMSSERKEELKNHCKILGYEDTKGYVIVIECCEIEGREAGNKIEALEFEKNHCEYKRVLKTVYDCIVGPVMLNRIVVYVFDNGKNNSYEQKIESIQLAQKFLNRANSICKKINVGIGSICEDVTSSNFSYREALHALKLISDNNEASGVILHTDDVIAEEKNSVYEFEEIIENIYEKILTKDEKAIQELIDEYTLSLTNSCNDINIIKNQLIGLIVELGKRWSVILMDSSECFLQIAQSQNPVSLRVVMNNFLTHNLNQIFSNQKSRTNEAIQKANEYIENHFSEQIMLKDIAREVNLSTYYFSHFYKQETGINISDKLSKVRIEKAKELLKAKNNSVKDVSNMVGYLEPTYFSKIFKKMTGYTPGEYKRMAENL